MPTRNRKEEIKHQLSAFQFKDGVNLFFKACLHLLSTNQKTQSVADNESQPLLHKIVQALPTTIHFCLEYLLSHNEKICVLMGCPKNPGSHRTMRCVLFVYHKAILGAILVRG